MNRAKVTKDAPFVTPRIEGDAIGLRVIPCIIAPATERHIPTSTARIVRGNRASRIIR